MNAAKQARSEKDLYIELGKMKQHIETCRAKDLTEWWGKQEGKMPTAAAMA